MKLYLDKLKQKVNGLKDRKSKIRVLLSIVKNATIEIYNKKFCGNSHDYKKISQKTCLKLTKFAVREIVHETAVLGVGAAPLRARQWNARRGRGAPLF